VSRVLSGRLWRSGERPADGEQGLDSVLAQQPALGLRDQIVALAVNAGWINSPAISQARGN
jgi:hypothetical protein